MHELSDNSLKHKNMQSFLQGTECQKQRQNEI